MTVMDKERRSLARELLDPLCEATRSSLRPLRLYETDRLYLDVNEDATRFRARVMAVREDGTEDPRAYNSIEARQWWHRCPEVTLIQHSSPEAWWISATDYSVIMIDAAWGKERVVFGSQLAENLYDYLLKRFLVQSERSKILINYKAKKEVPPLPGDWKTHPERPLSDYQQIAVQAAMGQEALGLFMDRGTGKTATVIQRICMEGQRKRARGAGMYRVLVICPKQVRFNWVDEIKNFAVTRGKTIIVKGGQEKRVKRLIEGVVDEPKCDWSTVVVAYDSLAASIDAFKRVKWDLVVLDESHYVKSMKTQRWKAIKELRDSAVSRMILTGTPIGNSIMDLWTQLEFLGNGLSGFQSFAKFATFHGQWEQRGPQGIEKLVGLKNVPLLQERLARLTFTISKEEAGLRLPDKVYDVLEVQMTERQAEIYNKVAAELMCEIQSMLDNSTNDSLVVENVLTRLMRLAQITSGHVVWDPVMDEDGGVKVPKRVENCDVRNPKIDAIVEELCDEDFDPNCKTIIWAVFRHDIRDICAALDRVGIEHVVYYGDTSDKERDLGVALFNNDPTVRVIVANPQTAGEGLNLLGYDKMKPEAAQTYCGWEVFFSQNWSAILRAQAEDRAHRRGARMPVRITDLVVPGTIDEEIRRRVRGKQVMAMTVTDLRDIIKNLSGMGTYDAAAE